MLCAVDHNFRLLLLLQLICAPNTRVIIHRGCLRSSQTRGVTSRRTAHKHTATTAGPHAPVATKNEALRSLVSFVLLTTTHIMEVQTGTTRARHIMLQLNCA